MKYTEEQQQLMDKHNASTAQELRISKHIVRFIRSHVGEGFSREDIAKKAVKKYHDNHEARKAKKGYHSKQYYQEIIDYIASCSESDYAKIADIYEKSKREG